MGAGQWGQVDPGAVTPAAAAAVVYLVLVGSIVAYTSYAWLLHHAPPSLVATYAYVNPVVAVVLGALLAGEQLTVPTVIGGAVIVLAVALIVTAPARVRPAVAAAPAEPLREAA
jgi:drug/metabolite transporter (DMT)-like permease